MEQNGRKDRLMKAFNYLKSQGVIHTQKELAERMETTAPNVSSAHAVTSIYIKPPMERADEASRRVIASLE